jgi:hypothetical protein
MAFALPVDLPLELLSVWAVPDIMDMVSPNLRGPDRFDQADPDDPTGIKKSWVLLWGQGVEAGRTFSVGLTIDNLPLRQVSRKSLLIVVGLILAALVAVLAGLVLGWRGPRVEALLSEASGEEIIERIAQLDAQFERGLVPRADYQETRERLLSLARYEVPELAAAQSKGLAALPPRARELVLRLRQIERDGAGDPRRIQERLLLLEDLARVLLEGAEKERGEGTGPGGRERGAGGAAPGEAGR